MLVFLCLFLVTLVCLLVLFVCLLNISVYLFILVTVYLHCGFLLSGYLSVCLDICLFLSIFLSYINFFSFCSMSTILLLNEHVLVAYATDALHFKSHMFTCIYYCSTSSGINISSMQIYSALKHVAFAIRYFDMPLSFVAKTCSAKSLENGETMQS